MPDSDSRRSLAACADPAVPISVTVNTIAAAAQSGHRVALLKFIIATSL
jgi:hypothetical protein